MNKKILYGLAVAVVWFAGLGVAFGNATTPVYVVHNYGDVAIPNGAEINVMIAGNGGWGAGVLVNGMAAGGSAYTYHDWGSQYGGGPATVSCANTNIRVLYTVESGTDGNGSPHWDTYIDWHPGPCLQDYIVSWHNPYSTNASMTIVWHYGVNGPSAGVVGPYAPVAGDASGSETVNAECNLTYTVEWGRTPNGIDQEPMPDTSTNEPLMVDTPSTPVVLPTVPPVGGSNIVWQAPAGGGGATDQGQHDLGNGLNNSIWNGTAQNSADNSAIVTAINDSKTQAHADAGSLKGAVDAVRVQEHSDVIIVANGLTKNANTAHTDITDLKTSVEKIGSGSNLVVVNITNSWAAPMTNYASESTLKELVNTFSNLTSVTNMDVMSETTGQGISNLLAGISNSITGTNFGRNGGNVTNFSLETTQAGISNSLADLSNWLKTNDVAGGGLTNNDLETNMAAIKARVIIALGPSQAKLDEMSGAVGAADGTIPGGSEIDIEVDGGNGHIFRFRPEQGYFSGLYSTMFKMWVFIFTIAYAGAVMKCLVGEVKVWFTANRGRIQNLDAAGFNAAGLALYVVMVVVVLAFYAAAILYVLSTTVGAISWVSMFNNMGNISTIFTYADSGAMHLLNRVFPVQYVFSMILAFIMWRIQIYGFTLIVLNVKAATP
jgi:hypothetical protein